MDFQTEAQRECYEQVAVLARELFGDMVHVREEKPTFGVSYGSALINFGVMPWGDDDAMVEVWSWAVTKLEGDAELWKFLLTENFRFRLGAFSIDADGDVFFKWGMPAAAVSKESLKAGVLLIASTVDEYDDTIRSRWGGERASD